MATADELAAKYGLGAAPAPAAPGGGDADALAAKYGLKSGTPVPETTSGGDKVAPYGLSGVITGKPAAPDRGMLDAGVREIGAFPFGAGPAIQAGLETAVSKIPVLGTRFLGDAGYTQRRQQYARELDEARAAHPIVTGVTGAGRAIAEQALVPGSAALAPVKAGALFGAAEAAGNATSHGATLPDAALQTAVGGVAGGATAGALTLANKGIQRIVRDADEGLTKRTIDDILRGETAAKAKTANKALERMGPDGQNLAELFRREPALERTLAIKAESAPGKVAKAVADKSEQFTRELDGIYDKMEKVGRVVSPSDISIEFDKALAAKLKGGDLDAVQALRKVRAQFLSEYGNYGHLSAETMRGLKRTAARAAFAGDPTAPASVKAQVQRDVWGVFSGAIERQAAHAPGVDIAKLRQLNGDVSVLIPVEQALTERAAAADRGAMSLTETLKHNALHGAASAAAGAAGFAHGGGTEAAIAGVVAPLVTGIAAKTGKAASRRLGYGLAQMARSGSVPQIPETAVRAASVEYAAKVAAGMKNGLSLQDAVKAAEGD